MRQAKTVWLGGGIGVVALALVYLATRAYSAYESGGPVQGAVVMTVVAGSAGLAIGVYYSYLRSLSLTVDAGGVTRRAFGKARRIPRDQLQRVILASYMQRSRYASQEVPLVVFLDATGRPQLTLSLLTWASADTQAITSQLGLMGQVTSLGLRSRRWLRKEVPGALPWVAAHPVATTLIVMAITVVVVAALATGAVLVGA